MKAAFGLPPLVFPGFPLSSCCALRTAVQHSCVWPQLSPPLLGPSEAPPTLHSPSADPRILSPLLWIAPPFLQKTHWKSKAAEPQIYFNS